MFNPLLDSLPREKHPVSGKDLRQSVGEEMTDVCVGGRRGLVHAVLKQAGGAELDEAINAKQWFTWCALNIGDVCCRLRCVM